MSGFCWKLKQRHQYTELETREPVEAGKHEEVAEDETDSRNLRYPFQIFFILSTEVCERFSYYGMNAILTFYLIFLFQKTMSEKEAEDLSTVIFHLFKFFCYATPVFGAALADSVFGKFRTIFYLSILYAIGQSILAFGAVSDSEYGIEGLPNLAISSIGIFLIAIGTGGIKPCVVALGADQFKVPEQKKQMATYFAMFYASINFGSLISTIVTPYLRKVPCLGEESCYSLAFGVPAGLMAVALVIFALGKPMYTVNIPKRNVLVDSVKCIWCAIKNRRSKLKDGHWLDVAAPEFGDTFVQDLKAVFRVSAIFLMYPMYWALYDQQGSRWTIQASKMNGYTFGFQILPDQMQVANPVLILLLIPLFDVVIYPLLGKCNLLKTPLQRIVTGCFLVAVAFIVSGILELQLKTTFPDIPSVSQGRLTIHNGLNTPITWKGDSASKFGPSLESSGTFSKNIDIGSFNIEGVYNDKDFKKSITLISQQNLTIIFRPDFVESNDVFYSSKFGDIIDKTDDGMPRVRFYVETNSSCGDESTVVNISQDEIQSSISVNKTNPDSSTITLESIGEHTISLSCKEAEYFKGTATFEIGGSYIVFVYDGTIHVHALTQPNTIHIFWILPQYIILTVGEILFSITSLEFAYSQAPVSMKSIMQSLFYLTTAVGNLITLIVVEIVSALELEQWIEFFLFAGLLVLFTFLLMLFTIKYKYVYYTEGKEKKPEDE
ncbi:peptide transporter family 2 isoform X2 [Eurytemora carolleeae]|uniref:peptide transporter family 2 isoform X2 n=1 Tax=Eurytemora carolleeae TaxID=1294199 RepID=UPI000C7614CC|nr:peptide transporter family 2 isoform X2 [Eurytemora carolleeae]|eukprot:XP_023320404.1 peptide transporter family 2-like isoform X2 [Eurytemora affinis]